MPISGGGPGLTFNFEYEQEEIPSAGSLVIGDAKIISNFGADGAIDLWYNEPGWAVSQTPAGDDIDCAAANSVGGFFISVCAARWRFENAVAALRDLTMSVINVG